ncbi:hypothetical protein CANCADRAFT_56259 [Tortispora caseinolytica NRRL Y-17796]|uniref:Protein-serine/threonine kinase n=1 Tax=Tortispora caseinolytica NRRL Y-17796 TaxID=767744 RepID=A0A1E4TLM8_9ASCO|nr:hypothetical protein CANCADRAFT_56259 [Tortispora caseinolytica NRRL Y-17796]
MALRLHLFLVFRLPVWFLLVSEYASIPQEKVDVHNLVKFGFPPYSENTLLENAANTIHRIRVRLAHRLEALRALPYLVLLNPHLAKIYNIYLTSFAKLYNFDTPKTLDQNADFVDNLQFLVQLHSETIETLSKGFSECKQYMNPVDINTYIDLHLRDRIGTRLLAEHHIALTNPISDSYIGAIDTKLKPATVVRSCAQFVSDLSEMKYGAAPKWKIDHGEDVEMVYIPVHLEYILTEIFKNSFRSTVENDKLDKPIIITIAKAPKGVTIRVRDSAGGISPNTHKNIFAYSFTTFDAAEGDGFRTLNTPPGGGGSTIAGMGYGLPLSRAYVEFVGGTFSLRTYYGWGTDVYIKLPVVDI